jgi:hypothetical protein
MTQISAFSQMPDRRGIGTAQAQGFFYCRTHALMSMRSGDATPFVSPSRSP